MNTCHITVKDNKGNNKDALLVLCPECDGYTFQILVIDGHNHLECKGCGISFCQGGGCDEHPNQKEYNEVVT